ncbi:hypothetical protein [Modestobacter lapidis]|nr:hypothetical protein [Modestobacter lapidis]
MRLRTSVAVAVVFAAVSVPMTGTALAADVDCADFPTQAQAQAVLVADPSDPNGLDGNDNGTACEEHAFAGAAAGTTPQVAEQPAGSVAAGDGSTGGSDALPYALGGLAFAAAAGCAVAARRSARPA